MSNLTVGQLTALNPTTHLITVASGDTVYSRGSVVQMVHTVLYTPTSVVLPNNVVGNTNIPDFTVSITPKSASSQVYVQVRWFGEISPGTTIWNTMFGLKRNGTPVGVNPNATSGARGISMPALSYYSNDANSTPEMMYLDFYDTPNSTSAVVYQVYANNNETTPTIFTNRTVGTGHEFGSSTITAWEIAQ
jgi:hypothetical protein